MTVKSRLLIVEDDVMNMALYRAIFRSSEVEVLHAEDALVGLIAAEQHQPDLIIMDLGLPQMDGLEATARLKLNPLTRDIPVLMVTAHMLPKETAKAAGCLDVMNKPIQPSLFRAAIEQILIETKTIGKISLS